ncbi:hypothetical protein Nepgr_013464 [Nepenthes gracilis]|uniref:Uncharacterized protein n=1 Tax=Nepenthes gracilis TaxID=150966 RepID=A0AAD3XP14_NEPGR|nr:hypothetical protein Nepgr_013464 [Nepenthes gracilis]
MPSSLSPADGDGQEKGDVEQVLPAAEPLCDSLPLPISLLPEIEVCDPVSRPIVAAAAGSSVELKACLGQLDPAPCVLLVNSESQPLGVTSRESPELLVSLHLPDSKAASFVKDPLHLEGQHIPIYAGEVLDDVSSGMPSEAAVEDAPTAVSTPSPHAVQCDLVPDDDSACRIASNAARESVPDGSSSGSETAVQGMLLCGANASPSCHQGPPARWTDEELFARQAINGSYCCCYAYARPVGVVKQELGPVAGLDAGTSLRTVMLIPAMEVDLLEILWDLRYQLFAVSVGGFNPCCGAVISLPGGSWLAVVLALSS